MKIQNHTLETSDLLRRTVTETLQAIFADGEFGATLRTSTVRRLTSFRRKPKGSRRTLDDVFKKSV